VYAAARLAAPSTAAERSIDPGEPSAEGSAVAPEGCELAPAASVSPDARERPHSSQNLAFARSTV
jgi:hypothetical protein